MNCFIVKNIVANTQSVYYGKKNMNEYTTFLIDNNNINDFIIEKKNNSLHVFKKIIHRGFIYNTYCLQSIFIIETIDIELDSKIVIEEYKKTASPKKDDAFIIELKDTLAKRLKNKLD